MATNTGTVNGVKVFCPWNPKNRELTPSDAIPILKKYGWKGRFTNFKLSEQACVHKSYVNRPELWEEEGITTVLADRPENCLPLRDDDNEELEFLGDRVLGLCVATYLSKRYPGEGEGFLTRVLSRIVNNKQLGKLAKKIGLSPWIILSRHMEEMCDGRNNLRIQGSLFEAWIGALYHQEQELGRAHQRPGQGDALQLTNREAPEVGMDRRFELTRQLPNFSGHPGFGQCRPNLFIAGTRLTQTHRASDCHGRIRTGADQVRSLRDPTNPRPPRGLIQFCKVDRLTATSKRIG